jgi:hypothetical protein
MLALVVTLTFFDIVNWINESAAAERQDAAQSMPISSSALPPDAAVLIVTVCSVAKRAR